MTSERKVQLLALLLLASISLRGALTREGWAAWVGWTLAALVAVRLVMWFRQRA